MRFGRRRAYSMRSRLSLSRRQSATAAGAPTDHARVCLAAPPPASGTLPMPSIRAPHGGRPATTPPEPSAREAEGHLWFGSGADLTNCRAAALLDSAAVTVTPRCSPLDLVRSWCAPSSTSARRRPSLLRAVTLHQRGNPHLVHLTIELGQEIVRAQLVEIAPPSTASVVPDAVATRHPSGNVASPAHCPLLPAQFVLSFQPRPRPRPYGG